jgi:predicted nucleic acid-binding protein
LIAVDSSVVVPAFASWHEAHLSAIAVVRQGAHLPAHAAVESFSVITRLPPPQRSPPAVAAAFLKEHFEDRYLTLSATGHQQLLQEIAEAGIMGGAVYDALVAGIAREAGAMLVSRDVRAAATYEAMGAHYELLT